jgi:hypothetical protein
VDGTANRLDPERFPAHGTDHGVGLISRENRRGSTIPQKDEQQPEKGGNPYLSITS